MAEPVETAQIVVRHGVDLKTFRDEILPANQPVVLKGLVQDWPAVRAGRQSARALGDYLRAFDQGKQVAILEGPPSIRGHFFYRDDMRGLNFERRPATISATIERFLAHCHRRRYPSRTDVFRPGDPASTLYYIVSGSVSIITEEDDGRELVLGYFGLRMIGVDRWGTDLELTDPNLRVRFDFDEPAAPDTIRKIVVAMTVDARKSAG